MPRKKHNERASGAAEVRKLWDAVDPQRWYLLLRELAPGQAWTLSGKAIKGRCPFHHDTDPSFVLDFSRGRGRCYGSCETYVSDIALLIARLRRCSYAEALLFIIARFDLGDTFGQRTDDLAAYRRIQEMKSHAAQAMRDVASEYIRDRPAHLAYLRPAMIYLEYGRGIPPHRIAQLPLGLYAKPEHVKAHLHPSFHEGFDAYFAKYRQPKFWGSLCFWFNDGPDSISRFKLRLPAPGAALDAAQHGDPAAMPVDAARALYGKDFVFVGDQYTRELGVFGLHHYKRAIGRAGTDAHLTEGEFDALAVMAAQIQEEREDCVMLAAGGKSGVNLSFLREYGIRTLWIVQDHPARNGDSFAAALLRSPGNFAGDSLNRPLAYKIFRWPPELRGGDLDEAVRLMGYEAVSRFLCAGRAAHFSNAMPWIRDQCDKALSAVKADARARLMRIDPGLPTARNEEANILDDQARDVRGIILEWFRCVHDPAERLAYTQHYAASEGIDIALLGDVNQTLYALDTVEGVKARLKAGLKDFLEFAYYEPGKNGNQYILWSKRLCETVTLPLTDAGLEQVISLYAGSSMLDWMRSLLGKSPVLLAGCSGKEPLADEKRVHANALFLLRQAVLGLTSECRPAQALKMVGQGIHYGDLPGEARGLIYFVNGAHVFRGRYDAGAGVPVEWERINSAADKGMLFSLHPGRTWSSVEDVSDLYAAAGVPPRGVFERVRTLLDAWRFRDHEIMREYLAAWIMSLPVQRALGQVNITFLTGESTSGKTSFVRGLLGGTDAAGHDVPCILEAARFATDATPAWIYQEMHGSSLLLGLDEAETRFDTEHGQRINEIQRMLYSLPTGGVTMTRGGATPELRASYHLRMPVIMAAISMQTDPVFLTRVVVVKTKKDPLRKNVGDAIADLMSEDELARLRRELTVGLLPHIPALRARKSELYKRLLGVPTAVVVTSRFIISLLTVLTIYEFLGYDPIPLYQAIIERNRSRLEALNNHDFQSDVLNAVLYTDGIRAPFADGPGQFVSARSLILAGEYNLLSNTDSGVYVLEERGWIVIVWRQAKYGILSRGTFRHMDESAMKESAAKSAFVVHDISLEDHVYVRDALRLPDIRSSAAYTVLDMAYLLSKDAQDRLRCAPPRAETGDGGAEAIDFTL